VTLFTLPYTPVVSGLRSSGKGVPPSRKPQVRSRSQVREFPRPGPGLDLTGLFRDLVFSHTVFVTEEVQEVQERDYSTNEERYIIDDDDMQDSPTDSPDLWIPERNEDDTKFVRVLADP
jgi:hypothetical protein